MNIYERVQNGDGDEIEKDKMQSNIFKKMR
jgi:hypothetical protein